MPAAVALFHSLAQQSQISQGKGKKSQFSIMNGHQVTEEVTVSRLPKSQRTCGPGHQNQKEKRKMSRASIEEKHQKTQARLPRFFSNSANKALATKWVTEMHLLYLLTCCCCSVSESCPTLYNCIDCSTLALPVPQYLPELAQTRVHWVDDAIQPSHPLSLLSSSAFNLSQHQDLFHLVGFSHQVAKM